MSVNLIKTIQENLGSPPLKKIDPNTQQPIADEAVENKFSQAAIPSVLAALYKYVQTDEGAAENLRGVEAALRRPWQRPAPSPTRRG